MFYAGLVGVLITLLLAFLIGGYVAGRMASRSGIKHGLLLPLLALLVTLVLTLVGAILGASFIDQLTGVTLPGPMQNAARGITRPQNLGTILGVSGILALHARAPEIAARKGALPWGFVSPPVPAVREHVA